MRKNCNCMQSVYYKNTNVASCTENVSTNNCSNVPTSPATEYVPEKCLCGYEEDNNGLPENPVLGQSYVPIQEFNKTFPCEVALKMGTLYPELVRPYYPGQSICDINRIKALNEKGVCKKYGNM